MVPHTAGPVARCGGLRRAAVPSLVPATGRLEPEQVHYLLDCDFGASRSKSIPGIAQWPWTVPFPLYL